MQKLQKTYGKPLAKEFIAAHRSNIKKTIEEARAGQTDLRQTSNTATAMIKKTHQSVEEVATGVDRSNSRSVSMRP